MAKEPTIGELRVAWDSAAETFALRLCALSSGMFYAERLTKEENAELNRLYGEHLKMVNRVSQIYWQAMKRPIIESDRTSPTAPPPPPR